MRAEKIESDKLVALKDRQLNSLQELCRRLQKNNHTTTTELDNIPETAINKEESSNPN